MNPLISAEMLIIENYKFNTKFPLIKFQIAPKHDELTHWNFAGAISQWLLFKYLFK